MAPFNTIEDKTVTNSDLTHISGSHFAQNTHDVRVKVRKRKNEARIQKKKAQSKISRRLKRELEAETAQKTPKIRQRILRHHVKGAPSTIARISVPLTAASTSWVGSKNSAEVTGLYKLEDFIGVNSKFNFKLKKWDGR
jgi:hypothetical protein